MENSPKDLLSWNNTRRELDTSSLPLPKIIRYYDDFSENSRTIRSEDNAWQIIVDGNTLTIKWAMLDVEVVAFWKKFIAWAFARYDPTSVVNFIVSIKSSFLLLPDWTYKLSNQETAKEWWTLRDKSSFNRNKSYLLRTAMDFMCSMSLFGWTPEDADFVAGWKWYPQQATSQVNNGTGYYLETDEEVKLIAFFDKVSQKPDDYDPEDLRNACILYLVYQFGMRAIQIAGIKIQDVSIIEVGREKVATLGPSSRFQLPLEKKNHGS